VHDERAPQRLGLGIAWRPELATLALERRDLGFVDVIAETVPDRNPVPQALTVLRERGIAVVPHGVSLSLGSAAPLDPARVGFLARLAARLDAPMVSEHVAFVRGGGREAGHLLPVPRTRKALAVLSENVRHAMAELPVPLALENAAAVFEWPDAELHECDFLAELIERTGCLLLLDLANLFVNGMNFGFDPVVALDRLPLERVAYVHVAGGRVRNGIRHDTHADPIWPEALALVEELASRAVVPGVVLEREDRIPPRADLHRELDDVRARWDAGAARCTRATAARSTAEPRDTTCVVDRPGLASRQGDLIASLVAGGPDPGGFAVDRLAVARSSLLAKRAHDLRVAWPMLAAFLGPSFRPRFDAWAAAHPAGSSARADALAFARALPAEDRRRMPLALIEELLARTLAGAPGHRRTRRLAGRAVRRPVGLVVAVRGRGERIRVGRLGCGHAAAGSSR
jgi:uncharacterized protein (UPF0276 family)